MSDWYQTVANLDADADSANALVNRLREYLISERIIVREETDCALGPGYAPGENYLLATENSAEFLFQTRPNGVEFIAQRSVFYSMGVDAISLVCSACGGRFGIGDEWGSAVDDWYESKGPGMIACRHCGISAPITDWQHEPPFAFGHVGVKFWNWPRLRQEFITGIGELWGDRVRLVYGKL